MIQAEGQVCVHCEGLQVTYTTSFQQQHQPHTEQCNGASVPVVGSAATYIAYMLSKERSGIAIAISAEGLPAPLAV